MNNCFAKRAGDFRLGLVAMTAVTIMGTQAMALDLGVSVGGVDVDVSVGHDSVASASASAGDADVSANVGSGSGNVAEANASVGGVGSADVCVGQCDGVGTTAGVTVGTTGSTTLSTGGPLAPRLQAVRVGRRTIQMPITQPTAVSGGGRCAGGGNTSAFNGVAVISTEGYVLGWVHDAVVTSDNSIQTVKMQANRATLGRNACYSISAGFAPSSRGLNSSIDLADLRR